MPIEGRRATARLSRQLVRVAAFLSLSVYPERSASAGSPPDAGREELDVLKGWAAAGDKSAQLELGERYEEGDGVSADINRAARLYAAAGLDSGGTTIIFVPQKNGSVSTVPISLGPTTKGLAAARDRLAELCIVAPASIKGCSSASMGNADRVITLFREAYKRASTASKLSVYPGFQVERCGAHKGKSLALLMEEDSGPYKVSISLDCLRRFGSNQVVALAKHGSIQAKVLLLAFILEYQACADERFMNVLDYLSVSGSAAASMTLGARYSNCNFGRKSTMAYRKAFEQGVFTARFYYENVPIVHLIDDKSVTR